MLFRRASTTIAFLLVSAAAFAGEPKHLGPQQCATCHESQTGEWQGHRHAKAYRSLPERARSNPLCLSCHAPDAARREAGVTCEACHGAGSEYAVDHIMRDAYLRGYLGLEKVDATTCARCHQGGHSTKLKPVDVMSLWKQLHHGKAQAKPSP